MTGKTTTPFKPRETAVRPPIMLFQGPPIALNEELRGNFSTFRRGHSWLTKLSVGSVVDLYRLSEDPSEVDQSMGRAAVTGLNFGGIDEMLEDYAEDHHATSDPDELRGILRTIYEPEAIWPDKLFTVVHLVKLLD